jgi:hypothetical protein
MKANDIFNSLSCEQMRMLIHRVASDSKAAAALLRKEAKNIVTGIDRNAVSSSVVFELSLIDLDAIYSRSGRTPHGYRYPGEAADEIIEEVLYPYQNDVDNYVKLGFFSAAKECVLGMILAMYRLEKEYISDLVEESPDAPEEFALSIASEWQKKVAGHAILENFSIELSEICPGWKLIRI